MLERLDISCSALPLLLPSVPKPQILCFLLPDMTCGLPVLVSASCRPPDPGHAPASVCVRRGRLLPTLVTLKPNSKQESPLTNISPFRTRLIRSDVVANVSEDQHDESPAGAAKPCGRVGRERAKRDRSRERTARLWLHRFRPTTAKRGSCRQAETDGGASAAKETTRESVRSGLQPGH